MSALPPDNSDTRRTVIQSAWSRSAHYGVDRKCRACAVHDSKLRFKDRLQDNNELITIGEIVMRTIFEFVKGSGFVIMLIDREGYVLKCLGDEDMQARTKSINCVPGYCWSEQVMGANAIGTTLATDHPIQFNGIDHWCSCTRVGTCSAAPIHDPDTGRIIGAINLTGMVENLHEHTLGMVAAGVGWIENEISTRRNAQKAWLAEAQKSSIIEAVDNGVFAVSNAHQILYMNQKARDLLNISSGEQVVGRRISDYLDPQLNSKFIKTLEQRLTAKDETVTLWFGTRRNDMVVNIRTILQPKAAILAGKVVILQEIKRIKEIAHRIKGHRTQHSFETMVGNSPLFAACVEKAKRAAPHMSSILLTGESGTGKDVMAQAIHNAGKRAHKPFVAINCAAVPKDLLASELFGYEDGAFTGAHKGGAKGKFELASGGTLFLDEIGEMPADMQAALLRVLEERAVMRVGGQELIPVDVRIISATHRNLEEMVEQGRFRLDLFYRLHVVSIHVPPLRHRAADIPELTDHLYLKLNLRLGCHHTAGITDEAMDMLCRYHWPGNIRELQNLIESCLCFCPSNSPISKEMLPISPGAPESPQKSAAASPIKRMGLAALHEYLNKYAGNKTKAAKELGISRSTLYRMLNNA